MSEQSIAESVIVVFGVLWTGCAIYQHRTTPWIMRNWVVSIFDGLLTAASFVFLTGCVTVFVVALIGLVTQ